MCELPVTEAGRLRKGMEISMNIIVLAGGTSTERDVSLSSGSRIYMSEYPAVANDSGVMTDENTYDVILSSNEDLDRIVYVYHYKDEEDRVVTQQIGGNLDVKYTMTLFSWSEEVGANGVSVYCYDKRGKEIELK